MDKHITKGGFLTDSLTKEFLANLPTMPYFVRENMFGEIILHILGINGTCTYIGRCKPYLGEALNIGWMLDNGNEYMETVFIDNILDRVKRNPMTIHYELREEK